MNKESKSAVSFLLFSYFKISLDDNEENMEFIINNAIEIAYADAVRQGAFNTLFSKSDETIKKEIKSAKEMAQGEIYKFIKDKVMVGELEKGWHEEICNCIFNIFKTKDLQSSKIKSPRITAFTYGNAQKWINMTLKNLYIIGLILSEEFECNKLDNLVKNAKEYHIPVDNYILQKAYENCGKIVQITKNETYKIKCDDGEMYSWSQIPNYDTYMEIEEELQELARKDDNFKTYLDWENEGWIEIARKRRKIKK